MADALSEVHWFLVQSLYNAEDDRRGSFGDLSEPGAEAMKAAGFGFGIVRASLNAVGR